MSVEIAREPTRRERRRKALLDAGTSVFLAMGYTATTLDAIVAKAGGSRETLYALFEGKQGLFEAIIHELCDQILLPLKQAEEASRSPERALRAYATRLLRVILSPTGLALYRLVIAESSRVPEIGSIFYRMGPDLSVKMLANYLEHQNAAGILTIPDPLEAARQFGPMVYGDLQQRALCGLPLPQSLRGTVRSSVARFLAGVVPR